MSGRSYEQFCGLAKALDVLGERWTLLVVRELLLGPQRYSDLLERLQGIGTNLLATRLKHLEANGLVERRRLPPPAGSTVYELTERGRALEPAMIGLTRWGLDLLTEVGENDRFRPDWLLNGLRAAFRPEMAAGVARTYRLVVDDRPFTARIERGTITVRADDAGEADLEVALEADTLKEIASGRRSAGDAIDRGDVQILHGDRAEAIAFADMLRIPAPQRTPVA
jgi:DNA-binding HxlR family transcriptional regulator